MHMQLACARIGAVHSVVFAGFSADSLAGRILDSRPSVVLTASAVKRGAKPINLKVRGRAPLPLPCVGERSSPEEPPTP
jgi:acyl-coenzyme A synthetase/AMP-(fatty) acid ligase